MSAGIRGRGSQRDEFAAVGAGPVGGFEYGNNIARLFGSNRQRFTQDQVIGQVPMEAPAGMGSGPHSRFDQPVIAVVGGNPEIDRCLGMVADAVAVSRARA